MNKFYTVIFALLILSAVLVSPAWAVQSHGGSEGLVAHQVGHVLFASGMAYLLFCLRRDKLRNGQWLEFKTFLWLLISWNILTFTGHWMNEFVAAEKFVRTGTGVDSFVVENAADVYFYLTRLDHLVLIPAILFLILSLKKWRTQT